MESSSDSPRTSAVAEYLLWFSVVAFAINYPILKYALAVVPPTLLNPVRLTLSIGVLALVYLYRNRHVRPDWDFLRRGGAVRVLLLGVVAYGLSPILFLVGMHLTTATNAALIVASAPIWTAVVGRLTGTEDVTSRGWGGLILSLVGTATVGLAGAPALELTGPHVVGSAVLLVDAALWGGFTALSRPLLDRMSPLGLTTWCLAAGLPLLYLVASPSLFTFPWSRLDVLAWAAILGSGVMGMGFALVWWNGAVKHLGATTTGIYGNLIPVVAVGVSVAFLEESLSYAQLLGGLCVVGGTALVRYQRTAVSGHPPGRLPG